MIGDAVRRKEDDHLVTGRTTWTANVRPPGTLHLAFLRSPVAHGRLHAPRRQPAAAAPGVVAVLTGEDSASGSWLRQRHGSRGRRTRAPALAIDVVRFPGEPVAADRRREVRRTAVDALAAIEVDYEPAAGRRRRDGAP